MAQRNAPNFGSSSSSDLAIDLAGRDHGGKVTAVVSALALLFSGYSLWDSSLKSPEIQAFVPPVIQYAAPYNNNFEIFAIPVTLTNGGGRTGTVLSMSLSATNLKTNETKRFYAADFGRWTMEKARAMAFEPFAPISLAGKESRTETVLFYTLTPTEKPDQLLNEPGQVRFHLTLDEAEPPGSGPLSWLTARGAPTTVTFESELRYFDARAFQTGTLPLYSLNGKSIGSSGPLAPRKGAETSDTPTPPSVPAAPTAPPSGPTTP